MISILLFNCFKKPISSRGKEGTSRKYYPLGKVLNGPFIVKRGPKLDKCVLNASSKECLEEMSKVTSDILSKVSGDIENSKSVPAEKVNKPTPQEQLKKVQEAGKELNEKFSEKPVGRHYPTYANRKTHTCTDYRPGQGQRRFACTVAEYEDYKKLTNSEFKTFLDDQGHFCYVNLSTGELDCLTKTKSVKEFVDEIVKLKKTSIMGGVPISDDCPSDLSPGAGIPFQRSSENVDRSKETADLTVDQIEKLDLIVALQYHDLKKLKETNPKEYKVVVKDMHLIRKMKLSRNDQRDLISDRIREGCNKPIKSFGGEEGGENIE